MKSSPLVFSLGGSLVAPNAEFGRAAHVKMLRSYLSWFQRLSKNRLVIVVVGGGHPARAWMQVAKKIAPTLSAADLDWVGIEASRFNARVWRRLVGRSVGVDIVTDPQVRFKAKRGVVVAAGWKPGRSTDYDAIVLAHRNRADIVYNLSNISGLYTQDPKKFKQARLLETVTWSELKKIVGSHWTPGLNMPFDPIAATLAAHHHLTVIIMNGRNIKNVQQAVEGQAFVGTTVQP